MPSGKTHEKISKILVGDSCKNVHYLMDLPYKFLGRKHRMLFHDPLSGIVIGYLAGGEKGVVSALAHIATDYCSSEFKKYLKNLFKV
jgi:uncharacterized metal-binding protein